MTDLEKYNPPVPVDSWVPVLGAVGDLAGKLASTPFVPRTLQGKPAAVAAAILTGRELDLGPMAALRGIDVVEGRPQLSAAMKAALVYRAGHSIEWVHSDDKRCTVRITRGDGLGSAEATYTLADAQRAGLAGKTNWQRHPAEMLRARALSAAVRMAAPDVDLGLEADAQPDDQAPQHRPPTPVRPPSDLRNPDVELSGNGNDHGLPEAVQPSQNVQETEQAPAPEPQSVTAAQLRKINVQLGELEKINGEKLGRDGRRAFIAGLLDLDRLDSAKELTTGQASEVIDLLDGLIQEPA